MAGRQGFPRLEQVVLDGTDIRALAEFYRQLLGFSYRPGDEPPAPGEPDPRGEDWLVLQNPARAGARAVQQVRGLPGAARPARPTPPPLHPGLTHSPAR